MTSTPHSFMGIPEAEQVLRLLDRSDSEADSALSSWYTRTFELPQADEYPSAEVRNRRLRQAAEDAMRWHGPEAR